MKEIEIRNQLIVRSPSVSKVTKNFMAPTISATSKTLPSPRKMILTERKESVRTSSSLSDDKFHVFSLKSPDHAAEQTEAVWKIDNSKPILVAAPPLEDDPSLQPYDPLKNYLAPRPQFLYYKPKPRVGPYSDSSDNESSEVDEEDDEAERTPSSEPLASATTVNNSSQGIDESNVVHTKWLITILKAIALLLVISLVFLPLLVMYYSLVITSTLSRSGTIIPESNLYPVQFYNLIAMSNEENYLVRHAQQYPLLSILDDEVMLEVHDNLRTIEQVMELGGEQRDEETEDNLDFLPLVDFVSEYSRVNPIDQFSRSIFEDVEHVGLVDLEVLEVLESELTEGRKDLPFDAHDRKPEDNAEIKGQSSQTPEVHSEVIAEELPDETVRAWNNIELNEIEADVSQESHQLSHDSKPEDNVEIKEQPSQSPEAHSEAIAEELPDETVRTWNNIELNEVEANVSQENHQLSHAVILVPDFLDAPQGIFGVCIAVLCVLVSLALMYKKLKKRSVHAAAVAVQVIDKLPAHRSVSKAAISKMEPLETPIEVGMRGKSCPSETSSFRRYSFSYENKRGESSTSTSKAERCSSSYDNKRGESYTSTSTAESRGKTQRRCYKRESLASSDFSKGSPSYGSFATYGIAHSKQGHEELVTPFRRSSRIKKQVTSS